MRHARVNIRRTAHLIPSLMPPSFHRFLLVAAILGLPAMASAQRVRTGQIARTYAENCAACHGNNLQGGSAPSMLDDVWTHGGDDDSLARSIREGIPEKGMPGWKQKFSDNEVRAMVIFIREQRVQHQNAEKPAPPAKDSVTMRSQLHAFRVDTWVGNVEEPWSLAFLPGDRALVTEKRGRAYLITNGRRAAEPIAGLPAVETGGQGGLYDVVPHPEFEQNGWLYFAFADPRGNTSLTRVIRGKLRDNALVEQQTVYQAQPEHYLRGGVHWGGRIAFDRAGFLFFTIGERGQRHHAQDLGRPNGKVHRIHDDGRVPADNPFVDRSNAVKSIWSYGHRNPQGLAFHPATGELYDLEHGPRGGDELNLVGKGKNYGWPVITYGMEYSGEVISDRTHQEGMEQPVTYWTPSLGVCGMNFYAGDLFPRWKNHLFVTSLAAEELRRIEVKDGKRVNEELIFKNLGRIRHVIAGPDGALYVLLPKRIARLTPAGEP
jgi:aldose sugar dehydrogenase